jgi:hypothetical protein
MVNSVSLEGLAGWAALIAFFALMAITNFAGLWWANWPITIVLLAVTCLGILQHGFN